MAFTYSHDPAHCEVDFIRFSIGDTNENAPILQDAEIQYIIDTSAGASTAFKLATAFRAAATALGAKLIKRSLGPQSEDASKRHDYYMSLADKYEKISQFGGTPPVIAYSADPIFDKNMMGNET